MKKKLWIIGLISFILCLVLGIGGYCYLNRSGITENDRERLEAEEYQAVFASMYNISSFSEEDFATYRGLKTICLQGELRGFADFSKLQELVFAESKAPQVVYLGIDPAELWKKAGCKEEKWLVDLQENIGAMIEQNSGVQFEITLPFPKQEYWLEMSEEELAERLTVYQKTVDYLSSYNNVVCFFYGAQDWLICNPDNYADEFCLNEKMAHFFLLSTVCDKNYVVNSESLQKELAVLQNYILEEKQSPTGYPDLAEWEIVFFGDSIVALEDSSSAVPEVVAGFSKAVVYDCAKGGTTAAYAENGNCYFTAVAEAFLTGHTEDYNSDENQVKGIEAFHNRTSSSEKLCFVINYGLNDYFEGSVPDNKENSLDVSTYGGALRSGIQSLKQAYPEALIIVATPNYISFYDFGALPTGQEGYILSDYAEVARRVAKDLDVICMDNYAQLGITIENSTEYLLDGVHLNGKGRLEYAKQLMALIEKNS